MLGVRRRSDVYIVYSSALYLRYSVWLSFYCAICDPIHRGQRAGNDSGAMAMGL